MSKKRMSRKKFLAIWCPCLAVGAILIAALEISASLCGTIFDTYIGKGEMVTTKAAGTEHWDTEYYEQKYATAKDAGGSAEAKAASEKVVEEIADEGMVLLKNKVGSDGNAVLPLQNKSVTLLGRGSVDPVYGGSGSGNVDTTTCATPKSGLENASITVNTDAYDFFSKHYSEYDRQNIVMDSYDTSTFFIGEIPTSKYSFTPKATDTAVVFISRCGGEGLDLSTNLKRDSQTSTSKEKIEGNDNTRAEVNNYTDDQHQLELSKEEKDMLDYAEKNYAHTVVVINASTTLEIGGLKDDDKVEGIIWAGSPGQTGFNALGSILAGKVNPSGRTSDIWSRDFTKDPTWQNFAINSTNEYVGGYESTIGGGVNGTTKAHFVEYEEGIYVGYKYYETAATENFINYDEAVAYPFGFGLSYTTFERKIVSSNTIGDNVTIDVQVTNTGNVPGKDVVEAYYTAPYTKGGIEKASTVLGDFAKTKMLNHGDTDTVTLTIAKEDMASYDWKTEKAYVLDEGTYKVEIKDDSHTVSKDSSNNDMVVSFTEGKKVYKDGRSTDKTAATNQFDDVSAMYTAGYAKEMSRADFAGTFPTAATSADAQADTITLNGKTISQLLAKYDVTTQNNSSDVMPTMNASYGLKAIDLRGLDYDDEAYTQILDQLKESDYKDVANYLANNAYNTPEITSMGKPATEDHDGPQGFSTLMGGLTNVCAYTSEPLIASTYNKELAKKMGQAIGDEALALNPRYSGWYGPAMNTHRSPFAGRNFEYYSEDGVLAGKIATEVVSGAADKGLYAYIKHFALNDQETWRTAALCTWATEQNIRETYLKPFEICVKNAKTTLKYIADSEGTIATKEVSGCTAVMSSFNRIGTTWSGGFKNLQTNVLRNEWGFRGVVISDFNLYAYMDADQGMRAGTDMQLTWTTWGGHISDTDSATARIAIRNALHNMLYTVVNSNAMQGIAPGTIISYKTSPWRIWFTVGDIVLGVFLAGGIVWVIIRCRKPDETAE